MDPTTNVCSWDSTALVEPDASAFVHRYFRDRKEEVEERHDAFSITPPYSQIAETEPRLEPRDHTSDSIEELDRINRYLEHVSREVHVNLDVRHCTWSDVLVKLRDASEAVAQRMERDETLLSRGGVVLELMSNMFQPVLQAIPDELGFLHAGLALVLHLAKGREKTKRDIVNAFEDVAHILATARDAVEHFPDDARLRDALYKLRGTLFRAIPSLVSVLVPKRFLLRLAAPFRTFQSDRLLEVIRDDTRRVQIRTRTLTDQNQNASTKRVEQIHTGVVGLQEGFQELHQDVHVMVKYALASQDGLAQMLSDAVEMINYHKHEQSLGPSSVSSPTPRRPKSSSFQSPDEGKLLALDCMLDVKCGHETQDLAHVRREAPQFDTKSMDSGASIVRNAAFQGWMSSDKPEFVYLEGKLNRLYGNISPISYFCAQLVWKLKHSSPTTAILHYFCNQHVASNDSLRGPRGLMRSLIYQLLRAWPMISLDDINLEGINHESSISIHEFCHLFEVIADQIPPQYTIFCIIDDVNRLERDEWKDEYGAFMSMLDRMASGSDEKEEGINLRFKVLITSSGQSRWLRDENKVDDAHRVLVTDDGLACR